MEKTVYSFETMVCISAILDKWFGLQTARDYYDGECYTKKLSTTNTSGYNNDRYTFGSLPHNTAVYGDCNLVTLLGEESDAKDMHLVEKIENGVYAIESKSADEYGWKYTFANGVGNKVSARVFFDSLYTIHIKATCPCDGDPTICLSLSHAIEDSILSDILEFLPELDIALIREVMKRSGLSGRHPRIAIERMIAFGAYRTRLLLDILKHSDERIRIIVKRLSINCRRDRCEKCGRCNGKLYTFADDALLLSKGRYKVGEDSPPAWENESHLPLDVMEYASCEMFRVINKDFQRLDVPDQPYLPDIGNKKEVYFPERTERPEAGYEDDNEDRAYDPDGFDPTIDSGGTNSYTKAMLNIILSRTVDDGDTDFISEYVETRFYQTSLLPLIGLAFDPRGPKRLSDRKMSCGEAITYVTDSEKIYEKLKDGGYPVKSCIKERCKTWKHAFSICDRNHAIFNDIDWENFPNMEPMKCEIKLPRWMERLRIKSKEAMVAIGENMHNCLRARTESSNLFFHWHNCALELAYGKNPHVVQCYDKFNHTTPDSTKMKDVFTKYVRRHINLFLTYRIEHDEKTRYVRNALGHVQFNEGENEREMCKCVEAPKRPKSNFQINIYLVKKKINLRTFFAA